MSLINDAIKRASQSPSPPPDPAQTAAGMRPVEYQRPSRFPWAIVIAILTPVFGLAIWFIVKGWELSKAPPGKSELVANARTQTPVPPAAETPPPAGAFKVPPVVAVATNLPPTVPVEPPKPAFPVLKLQGIFWRPSRPSAVVNAKTVYIGDRVETARVTAIDQESVTVQWESESKVLTLP